MKKIAVVLAASLLVAVAFGQANGSKQASLASARAKITQVIDKPEDMTEVMKGLSADDQVAFLSEVISALAAMPGDDADRSEKFVEVVNAALAGAQKGNALALVAEVFATVPPVALCAVNESLGAGLMNRAANAGVTYTDEQYTKIAQTVMEKVNERVANENNSGVRSGFAALMLIRGSNGTSNDAVYDAIVAAMPADSQNDAKVEWFPAALGRGREKTYEPMLAVTDVDIITPKDEDFDVNHMLSLRMPAAAGMVGLLADISGANAGTSSGLMIDAIQNPLENQLPTLGDGGAADDTSTIIGRIQKETEQSVVVPEPVEETHGYQFQTTH